MNPLESKHIAPLHKALGELGQILSQNLSASSQDSGDFGAAQSMCEPFSMLNAQVCYDEIRGVEITSAAFDWELDSRGSALYKQLITSKQTSTLQESHIKAELDSVVLPLDSHAKSSLIAPLESHPSSQLPQSPAESTPRLLDLLALLALELKGWRKGPFTLKSPTRALHIDSEWQSQIKWNLLAPHFMTCVRDLTSGGKALRIADVGCNNGFYMLAMHAMLQTHFAQSHTPESSAKESSARYEIIGFDPSALFFCQFSLLQQLTRAPLRYELLGVQDLIAYTSAKAAKFDVLFCLGVLYHRSDVFATLKSLAQSLHKGGVAFIDTLIFDPASLLSSHAPQESSPLPQPLRELDLVLSVRGSYAKMSNVYFLPTLRALEGWCERCGFVDMELLAVMPTTTQEQRKTRWIDSLSLESFLDPDDESKTIEGYPAPKRAYIKIRRA